MKVSARNMLQGKVTSVQKGAINSEVTLNLAGNQSVVAVVTNESVQKLGLAQGTEAYALVKAPLVVIAKDVNGMKFSTRNALEGTVQEVKRGSVNADVTVEVAGGLKLSAIITEKSIDSMGLKQGDKVTALFKASSVILATAS
jgi:molybdate transport system regulatory protein